LEEVAGRILGEKVAEVEEGAEPSVLLAVEVCTLDLSVRLAHGGKAIEMEEGKGMGWVGVAEEMRMG
jgi:hypothetical protein